MALYPYAHVRISWADGYYSHGILLFAYIHVVLLFRKLVVTMLMGTNIYGVLVIGGYLYS